MFWVPSQNCNNNASFYAAFIIGFFNSHSILNPLFSVQEFPSTRLQTHNQPREQLQCSEQPEADARDAQAQHPGHQPAEHGHPAPQDAGTGLWSSSNKTSLLCTLFLLWMGRDCPRHCDAGCHLCQEGEERFLECTIWSWHVARVTKHTCLLYFQQMLPATIHAQCWYVMLQLLQWWYFPSSSKQMKNI